MLLHFASHVLPRECLVSRSSCCLRSALWAYGRSYDNISKSQSRLHYGISIVYIYRERPKTMIMHHNPQSGCFYPMFHELVHIPSRTVLKFMKDRSPLGSITSRRHWIVFIGGTNLCLPLSAITKIRLHYEIWRRFWIPVDVAPSISCIGYRWRRMGILDV
jgi:hypothetical protein